MAIRLQNTRFNGLVAAAEVVVRFAVLSGIQVQIHTIFLDGFPGKEALDFFSKSGHHILIRSDKSQHIAINARRSTPGIQNILCSLDGSVARIVELVRLPVFQNDKADILLITDIHRAIRANMYTAKGTFLPNLLQTALNLHLNFFLRPLTGTIFDSLSKRGTGIKPEAVIGGIAIEVRQSSLQRT